MNPQHTLLKPELLVKQGEGLFSTDGMLLYDKSISRLIYMYYYRNQFICMDTNLKLLYKGKTIDTISRAQIKVSKIKSGSENTFTLSVPPLVVNKKGSVYKGCLFVHSNIIAKNETKKAFDNASVIDVYNLKAGSYKFSFYLPDYNNTKMFDFAINGNTLIALYDHYIFVFELNDKYF